MANQTITTAINYDDAAISGLLNGETITINAGSVTVNADVRWNQQAAVLGPVTISSTVGGTFNIDGTQVWEVPFSASTGNVPTQGALGTNNVTGGTSGATGELTRVWATGSLDPAAAGGAMPATGFIKLRSRVGNFQAGEIITLPGGATVTAVNAGKRALTSLLAISDDPETKQVLQAMSMLNMEGEGIEDVRDYFRQKMVRAGVIKPTDEEKEQMMAEMQNMPPDPNTILVEAMAKEAEAKAEKAQAETMETMAAAELKKAQTMKTMSDIGKDISQDGMPTMQNNAMQQENENENETEMEDEDKDLERKNKELELESKQLENDLKRAKIEAMFNDQTKQINDTVREASKSLLAATQAIERLENSKQTENNPNINLISEAINKIGDAINTFSNVSAQNTQNAISMISKPKRLIRENGKITKIETE